MLTTEKYKITDTGRTFSFTPYRERRMVTCCTLLAALLCSAALLLIRKQLNEGVLILACIILPYIIIHALYNLLVRFSIRYTFDGVEGAVYRSTVFRASQKLMALDEVVVFTISHNGTWSYAIGAKKKHFVKSYRISGYFGAWKNTRRVQEYETLILARIHQLVYCAPETTIFEAL